MYTDIPDDEFPILPEAVQMILKACGRTPCETLVTCGHCGCVTEIGHRCDYCGRVV